MPLPTPLQTIINFLRAGYPEGIPIDDYVPLFALLKRRLSDEEVKAISDEIIAGSPSPDITAEQISSAIQAITDNGHVPSEKDIDRVAEHLVAGGWIDVTPPHLPEETHSTDG